MKTKFNIGQTVAYRDQLVDPRRPSGALWYTGTVRKIEAVGGTSPGHDVQVSYYLECMPNLAYSKHLEKDLSPVHISVNPPEEASK